MNKDIIYVEPEDDITDIILKIEKSKEKIIALVPPKKAGVFRSIVNIKLMQKTAVSAKKTIVLVTIDPSIVKLAATTKIPVAKNLQTAPVVPTFDDEIDAQSESTEDLADDHEDTEDSINDESDDSGKSKSSGENEDEEDEEDEKQDNKKGEGKNPKSKNKIINWIKNHKKTSIFGTVVFLALIGLLVWMFVIAPAVTMKIEVQTTSNNLSEEIKFTTIASEENIEEGIFYIEEKTEKSEEVVKFNATGKKNNGNKATGKVIAYKYFPLSGEGGATAINNGLTFTINGLSYVSNGSTSLAWSGDPANSREECDNYGEASWNRSGCQVSVEINVTASEPGSKYNISASESGWSTVADVGGVYSVSPMTGGTDNEKTVVQQSDVNNAKSELATNNEDKYKQKLYKDIGDDKIAIESSFKQTTSDAIASPNIGEEVGEGVEPTLKVATTSTVYVVDKSKIEEFINKKADLDDTQKIYELDTLLIEGFSQTNKSISGKLRTTYYSGPIITEDTVTNRVKGKGLGEAQQELKNINGVISVTIDKSYPWVTGVPNNTDKITIEFNVKNQNNSPKGSDSEGDNPEER